MEFLSNLFAFLNEGVDDESSHHERCNNTGVNSTVSLPTYIAGASSYVILGFVTLFVLLYKKLKSKANITGMTLAFYICLILFMFCRTTWVVIEAQYPGSGPDPNIGLDYFNKIWNRVCFCIYLFVFNSLLFYWIDTIHTTVNVAFAKQALSGSLDFGFITPRGRKVFLFVTGLVIFLVLGIAIVRIGIKSSLHSSESDYNTMKTHATNLDLANNIIISVMFLVYGIFFLYYGTKLNCRVYKTSSDSKVEGVWVTELFSILLLCCFVLRCIMFVWKVITDCDIDGDVFEILTYYVPELIPAVLVLLSVNSKLFKNSEYDMQKSSFESVFVDPLLKEQQDNEMALAANQ